MLKLYNTLTKATEPFTPLEPNLVRIYTCGPTVYNFAHIGNLRTYIFADILRRVLEFNGYAVNHAMNITDVGHLTSDEDDGDDKMEVGAAREGKHPLEVAQFYEEQFMKDIAALHINTPHQILQATKTIPEQIAIIKQLEAKGFTYQDDTAIYFDTSKWADYGKLSGQKLEEKLTGAREEVVIDERKRNPQDFVLWFFTVGKYEHHVLRWPSPWGEGFPGWHIECSAISRKLLGQPFDIHTGGVDHIGTHHTNEIAQSEAAFGKPLANWWMHGEFLLVDAGKMGKSLGNFLGMASIIEKGFNPLAYRYLCLTAHYRSQLNFTWDSLQAAQTTLTKLHKIMNRLPDSQETADPAYMQKFITAINEDLSVPQALAIMWELIGDNSISDAVKKATILKFDEVFGLNLKWPVIENGIVAVENVPQSVRDLIEQRAMARTNKDFELSDRLRAQIAEHGYEVKDSSAGQELTKI